MSIKPTFTGLVPEEITALLPPGKEKYRGMQIFRWIHERGVDSFEDMTNLSKAFRSEIGTRFSIGAIEQRETVSSSDGSTIKYLWGLSDGAAIESVIIRDEDRVTLCLSSQVGCRMRCSFCRTGRMGLIRNMTAGEIIDQVIKMRKVLAETGEDITNVVFMGMGEPLENFEGVARAIDILNRETALMIGLRKITVSTCGIPDGIVRLGEQFRRIGLAVSLNAPDDKLRNRLMPINRKYPLKKLLDAVRHFARITGRRVTFEYILMDGINDSPEHARKLLAIARTVPSKINLIAFNEFEGSPFNRPPDSAIERFQAILFDGNITAMMRKSKGTDILAACGQLASHEYHSL